MGQRAAACTVAAVGLMATVAAGQPATNATPGTDPEQAYRAHFAAEPRYLYGCGVVWAKWLWPGQEAKREYDGQCIAAIKAMGGTSVPVDLPWGEMERSPGKWSFEYEDHLVKEAEERGLTMFAYMGTSPDWAVPPEAPKGHPGIGFRFPPAEEHREQFIAYCKTVAKRYKGRVKYYQFWNEPNGCSWVRGGCANSDLYGQYTKWLKIWYTAVKEVDPDCVLGAGALDYSQGIDDGYKYLEGMYREGAKGYFDAFNIHPYDKKGTLHFRALEDTRRVMVTHGDGNKGLWLSEYGWNTRNEEDKAKRLTQALTELNDPKYYYVTMANYLIITDLPNNDPYGLCDRDLKPRKAYLAFKAFVEQHKPREQKAPAPKRGTAQ